MSKLNRSSFDLFLLEYYSFKMWIHHFIGKIYTWNHMRTI
jgi:hypothetical protein